MPYLQVSDAHVAASFLKIHDAMVSAGQQPHRVTTYFCGQHDGTLREDLERHAAGQGMSARLASEIRAYQLAKIDDTWPESAHRDLSRSARGCPAAKVPYLAALQRAHQNLATLDSMSATDQQRFYSMVSKHKAIVHSSGKRAQSLVAPRGVSSKAMRETVYRCGQSALRDWCAEVGHLALQVLPAEPKERLRAVERAQVEFLRVVLKQGVLVSVPQVTDAELEAILDSGMTEGSATLSTWSATHCSFFIVVDTEVARKNS